VVTVRVLLEKVEGRKLTLFIEADDGVDLISQGYHERFVIDAAKFNAAGGQGLKLLLLQGLVAGRYSAEIIYCGRAESS
jgi:hypothetical protein